MPRPGSGYGRPLRPGPPAGWHAADAPARTRLDDPVARLLAELPDIDLTAVS